MGLATIFVSCGETERNESAKPNAPSGSADKPFFRLAAVKCSGDRREYAETATDRRIFVMSGTQRGEMSNARRECRY